MHFPTCKAAVKRENVRVSTLFDEFAVSKFTGYCKIILGKQGNVLALKEGTYILAESGDLKGFDAFRAIMNLSNSVVHAILCPLTPKQLQVTLMFNSPFRIIFQDEPPVPVEPVVTKAEPVTKITPIAITSTQVKRGKVRSIKIRADSDEEKKPLKVAGAREGSTRGVKNIDQLTLESIKELKETFQADAADLLKELHMEHLIQKEDEKEIPKDSLKTDK
ncbi:MAG: hypothetical protein LUO82_03790 [Methanomicrobiales archaeon]|nr:hypothetical protein [Methanomicrobiales archaeon]